MKIVNFYEQQIETLDKMLQEIEHKYVNSSIEENISFHKAFIDKIELINEIKKTITENQFENNDDEIDVNNYEFVTNTNKSLENKVGKIEREINELSKDFKLYLINSI
jgi:hypothetical protein